MKKKEVKPERIKVKVLTPKGERVLEYMRVEIDFENENFCETKCPYGGKEYSFCDCMKDPREPENKDSCYMAFCQEIDDKDILGLNLGEYVNMNFYVPVMGTLVEFLREIL
jgi:hypothetical protein